MLGIHSNDEIASPTVPNQIILIPVVTGLADPIFVTNAKDGTNRLFVVEISGIIKVVQPGSSSPTIFLDIRDRVVAAGELGLLGLAFHPQYETNRRFFVHYTRNTDAANVIAEYRVSASNPNVAEMTETVFLVLTGLLFVQQFGLGNDRTVAAGYDGDGKADIAVFRQTNGTWYISQSSQGFRVQQFGVTSDEPVPETTTVTRSVTLGSIEAVSGMFFRARATRLDLNSSVSMAMFLFRLVTFNRSRLSH